MQTNAYWTIGMHEFVISDAEDDNAPLITIRFDNDARDALALGMAVSMVEDALAAIKLLPHPLAASEGEGAKGETNNERNEHGIE